MKVEELEAIIDVINEAQTIEKEQDPDEFAGTELKIVIDGDKSKAETTYMSEFVANALIEAGFNVYAKILIGFIR